MKQRHQEVEKAILQHTDKIHKEFLLNLEKTELVDDQFYDPVKIQMWHHKFDPHRNPLMTEIPHGILNSQPQNLVTHKSTSVVDFLKTANMKQTLI